MKIRKNNICFCFSFIVLLCYGVISLITGEPFSVVISSILPMIPLVVLIWFVNSGKTGVKVIITAVSYAVAFIVSFLLCFLGKGFPLSASFTAAFAATLYLLPLIILAEEGKRKRWISVLVTLFVAVVLYACGKDTVENTMYLYSRVASYSDFSFLSRLTFMLIVLVPLSELMFRTKNNYLSDALIASSTVMTLLSERAAGRADLMLSPSLYLGILVFLIYIARTGEEFDAGERRKIVFSTLRVQEIAPLRKKRKPRVYEIPPNVPVRDAEDLKK